MDPDFIRNRITQLRLQKNISECKMSLDLGHRKGYIQSISSGKSLPSLSELLYICDYFCIEPKIFFDSGSDTSQELRDLLHGAQNLKPEDVKLLLEITRRLQQ